MVEPCYLLYRWSDWYLWGWDRSKEDYRTFKLRRMDGLELTDEKFQRRGDASPDLSDGRVFPPNMTLRALFEPSLRWQLVEQFGGECYTVQEDGRLLLEVGMTNSDYTRSWVLSMGDGVEVLEPAELRREIAAVAEKISHLYR